MNKLYIIGSVAVIAIIIGVLYFRGGAMPQGEGDEIVEEAQDATEVTEDAPVADEEKGVMEEKAEESTRADEEKVMEVSEPITYAGTVLAGTSAPLLNFTKTDYDTAVQSDKLVALYFYANWCPICKDEVANALYPAFNELTRDDVIGFRVSFNDNETDDDERGLAQEFGVAYQHTKVFLKGGKRVLKAPDSWDKERYLAEIAKALQ